MLRKTTGWRSKILGMSETNEPVRLPDPQVQPILNLWPTTGRLLGLSRQSTYDAATRGDIPTIRIGRRILVPTAALARLLCIDDFGSDDAA